MRHINGVHGFGLQFTFAMNTKCLLNSKKVTRRFRPKYFQLFGDNNNNLRKQNGNLDIIIIF